MKNSFVVKYSIHLWLTTMGVSGPLGAFISFIATHVLGSMLDNGIIVLDISVDRIKEAMKDPVWRIEAQNAYKKATARVYEQWEKDKIRKEYLDALSKYATYGNGVPDDENT